MRSLRIINVVLTLLFGHRNRLRLLLLLLLSSLRSRLCDGPGNRLCRALARRLLMCWPHCAPLLLGQLSLNRLRCRIRCRQLCICLGLFRCGKIGRYQGELPCQFLHLALGSLALIDCALTCTRLF